MVTDMTLLTVLRVYCYQHAQMGKIDALLCINLSYFIAMVTDMTLLTVLRVYCYQHAQMGKIDAFRHFQTVTDMTRKVL